MTPDRVNLLTDLPPASAAEHVLGLAAAGGCRVQRIVSHGQTSPPGFWYDQPEREWVLVLSGAARLAFADRELDLRPGDSVDIPARVKHRVAWTAPDEPTVWLAVFFPPGA